MALEAMDKGLIGDVSTGVVIRVVRKGNVSVGGRYGGLEGRSWFWKRGVRD